VIGSVGEDTDRLSHDMNAPTPAGSNPEPADLLEVGRIGKSHGLRGEVAVTWVTNLVAERTTPGTRLNAAGDWLTVTAARPHQDRWLVRFDGIDDRSAAERLRGRTLSAEPIESEGDVFVHDLVGKTLVDQHGVRHGPVMALVANPASDLLELEDGRLVPLAFYQSHNDDTVSVDAPAGLLDAEA